VSTPFLLVRAAAAAGWWAESRMCFYEAENRAASSNWVGANRYLPDFLFSKLLWV